MKILIIEDEELLSKSLAEKFNSEGFEVILASDGLDGLSKALEIHPDVILLDILMPKMDGISVLKNIRKDKWGSHSKVVVLTNLADTEKVAQAMDVGLNSSFTYLVKTSQTLESILEEVKKIVKN